MTKPTLDTYRQNFPESEVTDEQFYRLYATHEICPETGRLYPKGKYTSESPLSAFHMRSVEAAQLLEAGYTFTMADDSVAFDEETGELKGIEFEPPKEHCRGCVATAVTQLLRTMMSHDPGRRYCARHDGRTQGPAGAPVYKVDFFWYELDEHGYQVKVTDVREATDKRIEDGDLMTDSKPQDWARVVGIEETAGQFAVSQQVPFHSPANGRLGTGPDRWAWEIEIFDKAEADKKHRVGMLLTGIGRDYGEQNAAALARSRRCNDLIHCARKLSIQLRRHRRRDNQIAVNRCLSVLSRIRTGVKSRYNASVKLIVTRGKASGNESRYWEWWLLYLTKAQTERVYSAVKEAYTIKHLDIDVEAELEPMSRVLLGERLSGCDFVKMGVYCKYTHLTPADKDWCGH